MPHFGVCASAKMHVFHLLSYHYHLFSFVHIRVCVHLNVSVTLFPIAYHGLVTFFAIFITYIQAWRTTLTAPARNARSTIIITTNTKEKK